MLSLAMSVAAVVVVATNFTSPEITHFPGRFFDTTAKMQLQRRAMEKWPGPSQMVAVWEKEEIRPHDRVAILLGCAASHDPVLLPLYREAVVARNPLVRMAAAYGYRDLIGDGLPNVAGGVDLEMGHVLAKEIDLVAMTLQTRSLVEFWLQAALMAEGSSLPGWSGVTLTRQSGTCFNALDKIVDFEDFGALAMAWRQTENRRLRFGLIPLLEAVTLQRFFVKPTDERAGWGTKQVDEALEAADVFIAIWLDHRCTTDPGKILAVSLRPLGVSDVDPMSPEVWDLWIAVLERGTPPWRMMAARRLYQLGGRWSALSASRAESPAQVKLRDEIMGWYLRSAPGQANR